MRTLLYVGALIFGVLVVYRGLAEGMPAPPLDGGAWGQLVAFGFGALMVMVGARYVWGLLTNDDDERSGGSTLLMVLVAVGATMAAVNWKGRSTRDECTAIVRHLGDLSAVQDPTGVTLARFENVRAELQHRCKEMTGAARRCALRARSLDELRGCP